MHPVEIEIGTGKGRFLVESAKTNSYKNYIGIEKSAKYFRIAFDRAARLSLTNLKMLRGDAKEILIKKIPGKSVSTFHVYFPDPWWKKRHLKRRFFTSDTVRKLEETLISGGSIFLITDVENYYNDILILMTAHTGLDRRNFGDTEETIPKANYEVKYRAENRTIFRARFTKVY